MRKDLITVLGIMLFLGGIMVLLASVTEVDTKVLTAASSLIWCWSSCSSIGASDVRLLRCPMPATPPRQLR